MQWTGFVRYGAMHSASNRQLSPVWHQRYVLSMRVRRNHGTWQGVFCVVFVPVVRGALNVTWSTFSCEKLLFPVTRTLRLGRLWEAQGVVCGASVSLCCSFWRVPRELTVMVGRSTVCVMALHHGSCLVLLSLQSGAMSCV